MKRPGREKAPGLSRAEPWAWRRSAGRSRPGLGFPGPRLGSLIEYIQMPIAR